jgi:transposase-like protein
MKQRKPYKTYTREFKQEAVRLIETTNRPATEVAMELGIRRNQFYKWKEQFRKENETKKMTAAYLCPLGTLRGSPSEVRLYP